MAGLLEQLKSEGEAAIDRWISEQKSEDLYFDCKTKKDTKKPILDSDDRRNLGKAVSAFANSEGGLLLWGVDARKQAGVDCLVSKGPITQIAAFKSEVEHAITDLIRPPIQNLEIYQISSSQAQADGYLAISVPCSDLRPHTSERKFYFRNGHQILEMEVSQIRDQMLRRTVPKLEFEWDVRIDYEQLNPNIREVPVSLDLLLRNNSPVSARFPYIIVQFDRARQALAGLPQNTSMLGQGFPISNIGLFGKRKITVDARYDSEDWEFAGGADCCIHPGIAVRVASVKMSASAELSTFGSEGYTKRSLKADYGRLPTITMELTYGCLDAPCQKTPVKVDASEMEAKLYSHGRAGLVGLP